MTLHPDLSDDDIRMVQAMADLQMALSAADFLCELDESTPLSRTERRRYRCYEDAAVIAYWRPFSHSKGLPTLSLRKLRVEPTLAQRDLHQRLKIHRDKVIAHTDTDQMRLAFSTYKVFDDKNILVPHYDFDDGLVFFTERWELMDWLRTLRAAAVKVIFERSQGRPELRFIRDHLNPDRV